MVVAVVMVVVLVVSSGRCGVDVAPMQWRKEFAEKLVKKIVMRKNKQNFLSRFHERLRTKWSVLSMLRTKR